MNPEPCAIPSRIGDGSGLAECLEQRIDVICVVEYGRRDAHLVPFDLHSDVGPGEARAQRLGFGHLEGRERRAHPGRGDGYPAF